MDIKSHKILHTVTSHEVVINFDNKEWSFTVKSTDGKVLDGCDSNMATCQLVYFDYPQSIRIMHFNKIKRLIQKSFK